ncbi:CDP-glycerol glycerophosphotransferase family protein [Xanthomonas sp. NCPPB 2654]|uniref:CDP-glycerol glycerophosphotransferase family protein n=1 Tax=unclassified Xanthomonas TaxID=2643310 RepID=UPI0021DFE6B3|nr:MULTISPECIES: CDP-glycerol glycerophosphotransferase family protein [unclassified Xanthomonas]MDL5367917.1 CDP-glycerol glycerophosphotransferase family protein [Xanthomonas sp. NCPPB 2654]UYC20216.1 CDP-glycerol glycerophosphotransferase family protein [Xanthomonas sp. CFBP 8443]
MSKHYLLYGSERYALAILRPLQAAIRARGDQAAWFFDGPGAADLSADERHLATVEEVLAWNPYAVITSSNAVPHFFPGVKVETFHGFDAGKPRHIYVRGFFDLYCTTGPRDTAAFGALARKLGHFAVKETGFPKIDPFMREIGGELAPVRQPPVILYHSTFSPSWSAAGILYDEVARLSRSGEWRWIVTFHPKMDPDVVARYRALESEYVHFADNDNILELFPQVDLMCSDTSSALNEFLLTYKPVVTFKNRRPGPQLIDIDDPAQFEPAIRRALARPPELMAAIRAFADGLHPYRDGQSSERVLRAIDDFVAEGARNPRRKPWNFWRKLKIRRRIGYWGRGAR